MIGRLLPPADAIFDLLEQTAGLMKTRPPLFELTVRAVREPAELAKAAAGLETRATQAGQAGQAPVASLTKRPALLRGFPQGGYGVLPMPEFRSS